MNEDLETLISRYLEGLATAEEIRRLDECLRRNPASRKALFLAAHQDAELRRLLSEDRDAETLQGALSSKRRRWIPLAAAALIMTAAATSFLLLRRSSSSHLAPSFDTYVAARSSSLPPPATTLPAPSRPEDSSLPAKEEDKEMPPEESPDPPSSEPALAGVPDAPQSRGQSLRTRPSVSRKKPASRPSPPPSLETVTSVAVIASVSGQVRLLTPVGSRPARAGQSIIPGSTLETSEGGSALVRYPDGTEIRVAEGTRLEKFEGPGKLVHMKTGQVIVSAPPQPAGQPLAVTTPQARAEILGTRFTLSSGADATRLEVDEGRVRLTRLSDGASAEIGAGFMALAAPGWPLRAVPQEDVNPVKVEAAIQKGVEYLRGKRIDNRNGNVLIFLTLVHAGVPDSEPEFQALLKDALETDLEYTYQVALTAMALEEYNRVRYQGRIAQCAQFLVDNIGPKGQTRYGQPTTFVEGTPPTASATPKPAQKTGLRVYESPSPAERAKPPVTRFLQIKQRRPGPADHDHSNMQYAALGLRACHDAGIRFEPALLKLVDEWWREAQENDAGARAEPLHVDPPPTNGKGPGSTKALTSVTVAPQGWGYQKNGEPRGSMTAGGVGALCILDYLQGKDWRQDRDVLEGLQWLAKNFSVTENPKVGDKNYYYYMYGLERAGVLFGTETIGSHRWYPEGAKVLLQRQDADGKWNNAVNTCFAILFLKRATRPLVATGDPVRKK